jgi:hypothetical protein
LDAGTQAVQLGAGVFVLSLEVGRLAASVRQLGFDFLGGCPGSFPSFYCCP